MKLIIYRCKETGEITRIEKLKPELYDKESELTAAYNSRKDVKTTCGVEDHEEGSTTAWLFANREGSIDDFKREISNIGGEMDSLSSYLRWLENKIEAWEKQ